jgi:anti-anti-sigma factor
MLDLPGSVNLEGSAMELASTEISGNITGVTLNGRLDAAGVDRIDLPFTAAIVTRARSAIVDMSGVSFIASMGIRLLISTARALRLKGSMLVLFGAPELVQGVLDDAAIDQIIPIVATREQALARLAEK